MIKELPRHKYRRIVMLLLTAVLTVCMLLPSGCQKHAETKLEEIQDRGVLMAGTAGDYQPHVIS